MSYTLRLLPLLLACCCLLRSASGQAPVLKFKHISIEQGLSNSTIETIYQDKRGFIWIGTRDGLNRFDGYQMVVYRHDPRDSQSLSDNYIRYIYEDRDQHLWIGTTNGLNRLAPDQHHFIRYKHNPDDPASLSNNHVTCIAQDVEGRLWVSTFGGGLNMLNGSAISNMRQAENGGKSIFTHYRHTEGVSRSLQDDRVNYIYEDAQGDCWIATESGLDLFNKAGGTFKHYQQAPGFAPCKANNVIRLIREDRLGNLVLGTAENGVILFNDKENVFRTYRHGEKDPSSLASNQVRSLLVDRKGNTWIGGVNGGLDYFQAASGRFYHYQNEPDNPFSLSQRTVSALFEDNQGNFWVGTHRGGLNLYMPNTEKFALYLQEPDTHSLSYNDVKAFCEDSQGKIWIGTDGGGLNLFDRKNNAFLHYKYDPYNSKTLGSNEVLNIMEDSEGNLWVGTWGGGLSLFNRKTSSFARYLNDSSNQHSVSSNYIQKSFEDRQHRLWIATYYGGLNLLDRKTGRFTRITGDSLGKTRLLGNNIVSLNEDRHGNLWIGTDDAGLNCYHADSRQFTHYFDKEEKRPDLRVIFPDSKGRLWVGQAGLYLYDPVRDSFALYTDKAGLGNEFIKGMEEDDQGNFWISTANGLTQFNPETMAFKKYNTADGLQGLEFEANASLKTRNGEMFFGGLNGFNAFYPENIKVNPFVPPVFITDFQIFNRKVIAGDKDSPLENDISETKELTLSYRQSTFSFGFAALNYTALENNQYAYRLEPRDKDWNYVGSERKASYTNLSPGRYVFRVKASNNDGVWNEQGSGLVITILPPFWETWWFRCLIIGLIALGVARFYRFKRKLEWRKLEAQQKEEMHQVQLQFFTNISHELRTPLSLILGPVELLQKTDNRPQNSHYYKVINRNAHRLMNLINELMDFRKSEAGVLKLHVMQGSIASFLEELKEEFSELAAQRQMQFSVACPAEAAEMWFDRQVLEKIMINLISNAFKYTADGGCVTVEVLDSLEHFHPRYAGELVLKNEYKGKQYLYLRVADNGIGISKESIGRLFERYYRISDTHLGSGIGLAFVKSLTALHKGHIFVYSERGKGTELLIGIPVAREDYAAEERWASNNKEAGPRLESILSGGGRELALGPSPGKSGGPGRAGSPGGPGSPGSPGSLDSSGGPDSPGSPGGPGWAGRKDRANQPGSRLDEGVELPEAGAQFQDADLLLPNADVLPSNADVSLSDEKLIPHILIVEDNDELRAFLKESLGPQYHVTGARDGLEGLAQAKEAFPDLIISDVMMPGMDGMEFCRRVKADIETSHIPFLMLTARDAQEARIEGTGSGADHYFAKPLSMELLLLTIRNILHQKQRLRKKYFQEQHAEARELVHSRKDREFLDQLIGVIESHLSDPEMDVDYVCQQMGMSRTRLYEKIKGITGQSIGEFVRKLRLRKAVELMTHEDVSLMDVMYSVGIQTQSYFTKAFKKEFGKTPSQFLKELSKPA